MGNQNNYFALLDIENFTDILHFMRGQRSKVTKVSDIIDRINELRAQRKKIQDELSALEGLPLQPVTPIPSDFDYKEAIMRLFTAASTVLSIDNIVANLTEKNGFVPNRETVALRVGYLADSSNPRRLERVPNKRGFYRLKIPYTISESESSDG